MDIFNPTFDEIEKITFYLLTADQIRQLSVTQITQPIVFDNLNHPVSGGLYDISLGPLEKSGKCITCHQSSVNCVGHFGHIELPVPVYNPLTFGQMFLVLRQTCTHCFHFRTGPLKSILTLAKLKLLSAGMYKKATDLENLINVEAGDDEKTSIEKIQSTLKKCLSKSWNIEKQKRNAVLAELRTKIVQEFLQRVGITQTCMNCKCSIPALHRNENVKIFQKSSQRKHTTSNPVTTTTLDKELYDEQQRHHAHNQETTFDEDGNIKEVEGEEHHFGNMKYLTPLHIFEFLKRLWENEKELASLLFGGQDFRIFFCEVIAVPPSRFRPPSFMNGNQFEHPQNVYLSEILRLCQRIIEGRTGRDLNAMEQQEVEAGSGGLENQNFNTVIQSWTLLQQQVNYFFDSSRAPSGRGKLPSAGIKQILEKKEGLFRKHMMGKRVNYAARSVISPDPNLETCEIGVPMVFAKKLTYPEPITEANITMLKRAVMNGPTVHPGASHIQMEDGSMISLEYLSEERRNRLANSMSVCGRMRKVFRHIHDGDIVLMNRQPTLHKPSIMGHRVRVLPGEKTIRMHYANCNTYNADFDGDEMNMHFPQNEMARSEGYFITSTDRQYLVPTDGAPIRGLIQDHIVTGVLLTKKDTFLDKALFQQLLWGSLPNAETKKITTPPPTIIKPKQLWTGKQLITAILMNLLPGNTLSLESSCKISSKLWGPYHAEESKVILLNGHLLTGVMDKSQIGASSFGLTHAIYELAGPDAAGQFLTTMSRLLTKYDQHFGFSCRLDDLLIKKEEDSFRSRTINESQNVGLFATAQFVEVKDPLNQRNALRRAIELVVRDDDKAKSLDGIMKVKMNELTSKLIDICLPDGQLRPFPHNNMSLMTQSGAKGSMVNFSQISCCLGQQELEGRRVPVMVSGKTLPSFRPWDSRARAGGYISQRFLTGIKPQEFFFHCMAGREGLIDTAVKTSRSGYLQRCLIKHLEGLSVHYDNTVRTDDGSVLQFYYGEDGLDVTKQKYLKNFSFQRANFDAISNQCRPEIALSMINTKDALKAAHKAWKKPQRHDPVLNLYSPSMHLGVTSEKFYTELETFLKNNPMENDDQFRALMWLKYMRCLVEPGEAVGLLAAQSVGEPSTQMTLNTFHFAGFGAKNVTLGIPRLREIIMTASQKIKTPSMTIFLKDPKFGPILSKKLGHLTLKQIIKNVQVSEKLTLLEGNRRMRVYSISISLYPIKSIEASGITKRNQIKQAIENQFMAKLMSAIEKQTHRKLKDHQLMVVSFLKSSSTNPINAFGDDGIDDSLPIERKKKSFEEEEDNADGDGDQNEAKLYERRKQHVTYDEGEEDVKAAGEDEDEEISMLPENNFEDAKNPIAINNMTDDSQANANSYIQECHNVQNYQFDTKNNLVRFDMIFSSNTPKLLLLDLIERLCVDVVINQVPNIQRCFTSTEHPDQIAIDGVNLLGLWSYYEMIDLNRTSTNDIYAVLINFGVEAARTVIVQEIAAVFEVYGINVNMRHLTLIADYMTFAGGYRPFNRMGIDSAAASPLLKMTFETTVGFLRKAAIGAEWDECETAASRIIVGRPVQLGTGSSHVRFSLPPLKIEV